MALEHYSGYYWQDHYTNKGEKSVASFDYPQNVKLTWNTDLPLGRGKKFLSGGGKLDRLMGGWRVTAIHNYRSGDPLQIILIAACFPESATRISFPASAPHVIWGMLEGVVPWAGGLDKRDAVLESQCLCCTTFEPVWNRCHPMGYRAALPYLRTRSGVAV